MIKNVKLEVETYPYSFRVSVFPEEDAVARWWETGCVGTAQLQQVPLPSKGGAAQHWEATCSGLSASR